MICVRFQFSYFLMQLLCIIQLSMKLKKQIKFILLASIGSNNIY